MAVLLVTVVSGEAYERYAVGLANSADEFFFPHYPHTGFLVLEGREGWPAATMYRYHVLLEWEYHLRHFDYVFLCDADMRFEARVGDEILGDLVATVHPGYVDRHGRDLPFERRPESAACVNDGHVYYCGGFVGGKTDNLLALAAGIKVGVDRDALAGITAVWHDESHLNERLYTQPPDTVLSPSYCYPDDDSGYDLNQYERKLVALDKTPAERGVR